jgi:sialate O-acetylesterase
MSGTFFVNTGRLEWKRRKSEWHELAAQGNELGNHTVNHPCLLEQIEPHSQDYSPEMIEAEIRDTAAEITATANSHRGLTFAFPCGNMSFGMPADQSNKTMVRSRGSRSASNSPTSSLVSTSGALRRLALCRTH